VREEDDDLDSLALAGAIEHLAMQQIAPGLTSAG
jgi:hypothetical protein